jgi:hypothetical protein
MAGGPAFECHPEFISLLSQLKRADAISSPMLLAP